MVKVEIGGHSIHNQEPVYNYLNEKSGESHHELIWNDVIQLIKRDILNGLMVSYPSSDFTIDDFV